MTEKSEDQVWFCPYCLETTIETDPYWLNFDSRGCKRETCGKSQYVYIHNSKYLALQEQNKAIYTSLVAANKINEQFKSDLAKALEALEEITESDEDGEILYCPRDMRLIAKEALGKIKEKHE